MWLWQKGLAHNLLDLASKCSVNKSIFSAEVETAGGEQLRSHVQTFLLLHYILIMSCHGWGNRKVNIFKLKGHILTGKQWRALCLFGARRFLQRGIKNRPVSGLSCCVPDINWASDRQENSYLLWKPHGISLREAVLHGYRLTFKLTYGVNVDVIISEMPAVYTVYLTKRHTVHIGVLNIHILYI